MPRAALLVAVLATACKSVYPPDVAASFSREFARARLRLIDKRDISPARVEGEAMVDTVRLARLYLEESDGDTISGQYVRALLACAYLMRGENLEASSLMRGIRPEQEYRVTHENAVKIATLYAVQACRAVEARRALDDLFAQDLETEDFIRRYGTFVGIRLPDPEAPSYPVVLEREAMILREATYIELAGDPRAMERLHESRTEYHRLVGEQVYNDAASLINRLPERAGADTEWLQFLAVNLLLVYAELFDEVVPMSLSRAQKEWQLEQIDGYLQRAKRLVDKLQEAPTHPYVYDRLPIRVRDAELEIRGWIETR